jgi:hypothetical protein
MNPQRAPGTHQTQKYQTWDQVHQTYPETNRLDETLQAQTHQDQTHANQANQASLVMALDCHKIQGHQEYPNPSEQKPRAEKMQQAWTHQHRVTPRYLEVGQKVGQQQKEPGVLLHVARGHGVYQAWDEAQHPDPPPLAH